MLCAFSLQSCIKGLPDVLQLEELDGQDDNDD